MYEYIYIVQLFFSRSRVACIKIAISGIITTKLFCVCLQTSFTIVADRRRSVTNAMYYVAICISFIKHSCVSKIWFS